MKQKLLLLVTLLLSAVTSSWADDTTIFSITVSGNCTISALQYYKYDGTGTQTATISGGDAEVYNAHSTKNAGMNGKINIGNTGEMFFHAALTTNIEEGDVITSSDTGHSYYISNTALAVTEGTTTKTKPGSEIEITFPYVVPAGSPLIDQKNIYVWKGTGSAFTSFTVTRTTVTIDSYNWVTFVSTKDLNFTGVTGLEAYIVTGHNSWSTIQKTQVTGNVKAGTPLLIYHATPGTYNIPGFESTGTDYSATNKLVAGDGSTISQESGKTKYVLSADGGAAVFQRIAETSATVPAGKAYLQFDGTPGAGSRSMGIGGDGTTRIEAAVKEITEDDAIYNLSGQRVKNPSKGIYIVNGKKMIFK